MAYSINLVSAGGGFTGGTISGDTVIADTYHLLVGGTSQITAGNTSEFQVLGTGGGDSTVLIGRWKVGTQPANLHFVKSRNATIGSHTIVNDNDSIGEIGWYPDDGVDFATRAARFKVEVDDASPAAGDIGTAFLWEQMPGGGSALRETMRLSAAGLLTVGEITTTGGISAVGLDAGDGNITNVGGIALDTITSDASAGITITPTTDTFFSVGTGVVIGHTVQESAGSSGTSAEFQILGTGGASSTLMIGRWKAGTQPPTFQFVKSRNDNIGSHTIVNDNDNLGEFSWYPDDGVDFGARSARFHVEVDDASPAENDIGTAFVWQQMAGGGASIAETMRLSAAGLLTVATITTTGAITGNVTGNVSGTAATVTGGTQASITTVANVVTVGALNAGSITSGFGNIDVGASSISAGSFDASDGDISNVGDIALDSLSSDAGAGITITPTTDTFFSNGTGVVIGHTAQVTVTNTPEFQLLGTGGSDAAMLLARFRNNSSGPTIRFLKGRNDTIGSLAIVQDNDDIGTFKFFADDGVDFATEIAAFHLEVDDGSPTENDIGAAFVWSQMPGGGGAMAETMRLDAAGHLTLSTGSSIYLKEKADADGDVAGYGQIWVNTATPNELWWTNDAGTDAQLGAGGGGGVTEVYVSGAMMRFTSNIGSEGGWNIFPAATFDDSLDSIVEMSLRAPEGATGIASIKLNYVSRNTGTLKLQFKTQMYDTDSTGTAGDTRDETDTASTYTGSGSDYYDEITVPSGAYDALTVDGGDLLALSIDRDGAGGDTYNNLFTLFGVTFTFTN